MKLLGILVFCVGLVQGDIYFHNPRGSNNRLDERGRARNNANRMFDSQNNDRGGYNVGSVYYYAGSELQMEWTNQHSCGNPNNHCELIIQYMCDEKMRDGATTSTIPDNPMNCANYDCNTDTKYGMNEDFEYYLNCRTRERNKGLFLADQKPKGHTAIYTRQNPGGTRRGYECPEERDYYPYWHPSPWVDVAVMTNNATRCPYYQEESANVKSRWACVLPRSVLVMNYRRGIVVPNNKEDCEAFVWPPNNPNGTRGVWTEFPAHGVAPPECRETEWSRDNHLGNGLGGYPNLYNWTIPEINHDTCVLRIRYNISTNDYDAWNTNSSANEKRRNQGSGIDLSEQVGFASMEEAKAKGFVLENNPVVKIFDDVDVDLRLAINTAQYGRTFQDRSHTFAIEPRTSDLVGVTIHNLNVRGKRGNIVQVYPAVEYDFVPNTLHAANGDYVHFQWTGSNTNPNNNDGQGQAGTDRSNVVLQDAQLYPEGSGLTSGQKFGHWGRSYPQHINNVTFLGLPKQDLQRLALLMPNQFRGEMSELDDAGTYFDLGPRKITRTGTYHYMCTRNNNFSNRSQKGKIVCSEGASKVKAIGWNGGNVTLGDGKAAVIVSQGTFSKLVKLSVEEWKAEEGEQKVQAANQKVTVGEGYASSYIVVHPEEKFSDEGKKVTLQMKIDPGSSEIGIYRTSSSNFATWTKVDAEVNDGIAQFQVAEGGVYVARTVPQVGLIVGIVVTILVIVALVVGTVVYFKKNPNKWNNIRRSTANRV
ncbi:protein DD3-3-like [Lingula anatina]|uniref:Protein DD3-3-like n=1 Tax=Lingula anatina TaxID=7574 RepID=A0A1S3IK72_LINAN|nr:protein DD3-3-like [Lingula anatina]|eukprot:XP_013398503.1 protein DD3-3-like [Lingula anatina]